MSRRKARELALQVLFHLDFTGGSPQEVISAVYAMQDEEIAESVNDYVEWVVMGTLERKDEIDQMISELARDWKLERMGGVDRAATRMAIYEIKFGDGRVPPRAAVNEAVELAKHYGSDESGRFVNGILGSLVRGAPE
ncbi:MAG TPA: transcription antitermination factor NusB [Negativicutes bacterium]|nr:transcription antitermination factor NusB [Negativicutes bacterium]